MGKQVLSVSQMRELIKLGVDISKASAFYYPNYGEYYEHPITKKYVHDIKSYNPYPSFVNGDRILKDLNPDLFPTFTLQDILEMLPERITYGGDSYILCTLRHTGVSYRKAIDIGTGIKVALESTSLLDASFELLKWCKQNNFI